MINFDLMKLAQIFNPTQQSTMPGPMQANSPTYPTAVNPMATQPTGIDQIQQLMQPDETQFNRLGELANNMPTPDQFHPSKTRTILGALAALGTGGPAAYSGGAALGYKSNIPEALQVGDAITNKDYNQALSDWGKRVKVGEDLSNLESSRNSNKRMVGSGLLTRDLNERKLQQQVDYQDREQDRKEEDLEIKRARAEAYIASKKFADEHPEYDGVTDKDGKLIYVNKRNPSDIIRTDIETGKLSDMQKSELRLKTESELIKQRANESRVLERIRQENRDEFEGKRQENRRELETQRQGGRVELKKTEAPTKPGTTKATPLKTTAEQVRIQHPDWSKYIKIDKGITSVIPPSEDGGPDEATYHQIVDTLGLSIGKDIKLPSSNQVTAPTSSTMPSAQLIDSAKKHVEAGNVLITDGKNFGQLKAEEANKLPKGWMVVP